MYDLPEFDDLMEYQKIRINCPNCGGIKTFTATRTDGIILYNCYKAGCNLSFAGLKTAVLKISKKIGNDKKLKQNLAASFQSTINSILYKKTKIAIEKFRSKTNTKNAKLVVAGGVAANNSIRLNLNKLSIEEEIEVIYPSLKFCGDNAAMIAWAGIKRFKKDLIDNLEIPAKSRWPLDLKAPYMKGPGLKL